MLNLLLTWESEQTGGKLTRSVQDQTNRTFFARLLQYLYRTLRRTKRHQRVGSLLEFLVTCANKPYVRVALLCRLCLTKLAVVVVARDTIQAFLDLTAVVDVLSR